MKYNKLVEMDVIGWDGEHFSEPCPQWLSELQKLPKLTIGAVRIKKSRLRITHADGYIWVDPGEYIALYYGQVIRLSPANITGWINS